MNMTTTETVWPSVTELVLVISQASREVERQVEGDRQGIISRQSRKAKNPQIPEFKETSEINKVSIVASRLKAITSLIEDQMPVGITLQTGHQPWASCSSRNTDHNTVNSRNTDKLLTTLSKSRRWALTAGALISFCGDHSALASTTPYQDAATIEYGLRNG